jgi:alkanesulfonate monooxygenase SsuD/methylene tetrahydromethanopterin reductase-like flavin-dependent oxidoreductase (luciferase family)
MTRLAFGLGYGEFMDAREIAGWFKRAEDAGFELGFFSETIQLMRDSVTALTAAALATSRLKLGATQIVRLRTPVLMAQTLATLDELTGGRMTLAPGACTATHARVHALEPLDPVLTLTEWVESMRLLLSGQQVTYRGQVVQIEDVGLHWKPVRPSIPLYLAATSKTGLKLAGTIGDGVVLNAVCSPEYTENAVKVLRESVEAAGRDWSTFEVAQIVNCSVEDDRERALDAVRWEVATKFEPNQVRFNAGPRLRVGEPHINPADFPRFEEAHRTGGIDGLIKAVPDSYAENMTASGTPDDVRRRVERYRQAGVTLPILRPAAMHQAERLLDVFAVR